MQVIDISSSPEPSTSSMSTRTRSNTRQSGLSKKRTRLAREPSIVEIIELTDDDDDDDDLVPIHRKRGPMLNTVLTFGRPNTEILADTPGSSAARPEQQGGAGPLFLPSSDDERHKIQPPHSPVVPLARSKSLPPEAPVPTAPAPVDPVDEYVAHVLEIVPDVQPNHVLALIEQFMQSEPGNVVEFVLHALFENPSYPKVDKKGKHERDEVDGDPDARASLKPKVDYLNKDRVYDCGPHYFERSLEQLMTDFPRIPKPHIRSRLLTNRFYAPTHLRLAEELKTVPLPFKLKSTNSVVGKGKTRQDPGFDEEREWVLLKVGELATERDAASASSINETEYQDGGEGIECGCCFSDYPFDRMIQCPEAHLFCKSCMTSYASNLLGEHNPNIVCMDQSGCKLPFPESELNRFLSSKLLELYHRVKQRKEIEAAGLENLEECPFCEYKCVIENDMEKLFRCENVDCNAITCRMCKKPDHLPRNCQEAEEDKHLDAQHIIEEAMTQALMRNCPKCQKSFIKEMGCNKMTCPNCRTVSCYICRKVIDGYDHFSNPPPYSGKAVDKSKCNLWDPIEQRHAEEVSQAAKHALAELRKSRPDMDETSLKVDIPGPARPGKAAPHQAQAPLMFHGGMPFPPYMRAGGAGVGVRMGGLGADAGIDIGMGAGINPGADVGMGVGMGANLNMGALLDIGAGVANPFMFGAGQAHPFVPPALGVAHPPALNPYPYARGAMIAEPAIPLALARGRRAPRAQAVAAAGGGRQRRKGR